jgi:ABC-type transporter MlaC component
MLPAMVAAAIVFAAPAAAALSPPVAEVRAAINEATPVFNNHALAPTERDKQLRAIAEKHFDFAYMARSAMGAHWKQLTPVQRKEFVPLFENYVLATYLTTLQQNTVEAASHALKDKVVYDASDQASVPSEVHLKML